MEKIVFEKVNSKLTNEEMKSLQGGLALDCERTFDTVDSKDKAGNLGTDQVNPHNDPCDKSGGGISAGAFTGAFSSFRSF